jgi:hypothetical protein
MFTKGEKVRVFITFVEKGCCAGQCQVWGQTDTESYDRLDRLITEHRGKSSLSSPDPSCIHAGDIVIAQYDDDNNWYRAQVVQM